ncbi:MAG: prolyl oligopeptidase family serine peptidase, partial [Planctomycetota bacterium]|nr:prolyl oligopeptidase family serine peptidase [Planctomycetota bacterium]
DQVLLDPNTLSEDGTVAISMFSPSPDGSFLAWGASDAGSDWSTWRIKSLKNKRLYPEILDHIKNTSPAWLPDESGFYYTRFPDSLSDGHIYTTNDSQIWFHRLGTEQSQDRLVWADPENPERYYGPSITKDGGWLVVSVNEGTSSDNALLIQGPEDTELRWLVSNFNAAIELIGGIGDKLWFKTDKNAPNGKIVSIDLSSKKPMWADVIPEGENILRGADIVGGKITVRWLEDASTKVTIHDLDGNLEFDVQLPGIGTASGFGGDNNDTKVYWNFSTYNQPPSIYSLDLLTNETSLFWKADIPIDLSDILVDRVFVESKDGERIPLFLVYHKDRILNSNNPVLLYGYGGFDISILPYFSPSRATWIEMGGVYAVACLRGGAEYGRRWHEGGMLKNKQNVFDDFIACGEWLVKHKWTQPDKLGIQGGSNGGLLVGACMTQRPDLFGACLPAVGVMDMLRFHLFTVGWGWTSDYGSPDDPEMFPYLHAYSPYHNISKNTCYPPTLITTGDTDDRVVPGHSFKFAAELQHSQGCNKPVLIRIETRAGHGAGKPTQLRIDEAADVYAFLYQTLGMGQ